VNRRRMRIRLLGVFLLLCLMAAVSAQSDGWKQYKNADGNFSVLFPGEPKDTVNDDGSGGVRSHTLLAMQNPNGYMVVYNKMAVEQKVDEDTFRQFRDGVFKQLPKCEVAKEGAPARALAGYIGHWYNLNCGQVVLSGNLYWGKGYAYAVMAVYPVNSSESPNVKRFLESFALLDSGK
jgi:hypothetical protein